MAKEELSPHSGHRKRMRDRFLRDGIDSLQDHEVLELLLFYAIPRQDTNELAHRLLAKFRTLSGVFDAPIEELKRVEISQRFPFSLMSFFRMLLYSIDCGRLG